MAPALTKVLKDGHGIHLSSPLGSILLDSAELDSPLRSADALQKMWLNASSLFPSMELGLAASPLDFPSDPSLSSCLQASSSQCEALFLPSPSSLLSLVSSSTGLRDSHQVASVFPGVPDMFLAPVPEHNSQEAPLLSSAPQCGPGGGDVLHSPSLTLSIVPPPPPPPLPPPPCSHGEIKCQGYASAFPPPLTVSQMGFSEEPGGELLPSSLVLEEAAKQQLSRQAGLHSRAQTLRRRLQALLGEHAVRHCSQQLEGLSRQLGCAPPDGYDPRFSWLSSSTASAASLAELAEFSHCSQAVLQGLQHGLDSEATASSSSSSDEELEETRSHRKTKAAPLSSSSSSSSCERRWLEERAELGSRWSWLQLRLAELEGRIQQQVELHKHMRSMKRGVVLAESQPLTDRQIQQTLLREMAGLSCTASDADTEPCSPTRLLHNIERQSAQLSQIVNSLMPPLSFSPLSKQPHTWKGDRAFKSGHSALVPEKRRRLSTRRLFKADGSCVCARTRPLVTYHKPRLFALGTRSPSRSPQGSGTSACGLPSSLSSCSCPCCASCDPAGLCSDADCGSSTARSSRTPSSTSHPAPPLPYETPPSLLLRRSREEWCQRPLVLSVRPASPAAYDRRSSTPLHHGHGYKQHAGHPRSGVLGLSPIGTAGSAQARRRRSSRRKRKRRHLRRLAGDDEEEEEEDDLYRLCDTEDSSEEVLVESYTHVAHKQTSQGFVRKRQGESVYNINNIVIPMPVTKVEKLQYKDILTPSWRAVGSLNTDPEREEDGQEGQEEDLADEVFAQRHLALEQREKLRWGCWGQKTGLRHPKRSGSRSSGSGGGMCTSGEENSVELSCAQLEADEQQSSEEWLPQTPWEPRAFPLGPDDEAALLSDGPEEVPSGWSQCTSASSSSSSSKNYSSHLSSAQSSQATLPPAGHSRSRTPEHS